MPNGERPISSPPQIHVYREFQRYRLRLPSSFFLRFTLYKLGKLICFCSIDLFLQRRLPKVIIGGVGTPKETAGEVHAEVVDTQRICKGRGIGQTGLVLEL